MRLQETIAFYLLVGLGVAGATLLSFDRRTLAERIFLAASAALFWPMYLPLLLSRPAASAVFADPQVAPPDEMAAAIAEVNMELDAALSSLGGWAENVLDSERGRLAELRTALVAHAARIRSMDALLAAGNAADAGHATPDRSPVENGETTDRRRQSESARRQNVARLLAVRRQSYDDLMATLAWIRELVSMIHLAKFTGAPASRAGELVAQIAAAVEGISAVVERTSDPPNDPPLQPSADPRISDRLPADNSSTAVASAARSSAPNFQLVNNRSVEPWASSNAPAT